jgi:hypothetical protein
MAMVDGLNVKVYLELWGISGELMPSRICYAVVKIGVLKLSLLTLFLRKIGKGHRKRWSF